MRLWDSWRAGEGRGRPRVTSWRLFASGISDAAVSIPSFQSRIINAASDGEAEHMAQEELNDNRSRQKLGFWWRDGTVVMNFDLSSKKGQNLSCWKFCSN